MKLYHYIADLTPVQKLTTCATAVAGAWTLNGVLSGIASLVAIVVGGLHIYDWIQKRRKK